MCHRRNNCTVSQGRATRISILKPMLLVIIYCWYCECRLSEILMHLLLAPYAETTMMKAALTKAVYILDECENSGLKSEHTLYIHSYNLF